MARDNNPQQVARLAMQRFQRDVASGVVGPKDRFGARLNPGDMVIFQPETDLVFDVMDVKPNFSPGVPPGVVDVILGVQFRVTYLANTMQPRLMKVGTFTADENGEPQHRNFEGPKIPAEGTAGEPAGAPDPTDTANTTTQIKDTDDGDPRD